MLAVIIIWPVLVTCSSYQHKAFLGINEFRDLLQTVTYVPVLRRSEGFEMMGVEALFSGTRPIVYETRIESKPYRWVQVMHGSRARRYLVHDTHPSPWMSAMYALITASCWLADQQYPST